MVGKNRYEVVIRTHDGLPSSYKGVLIAPYREDGFLELKLLERTVFINLTDVVSYSVRMIEEGESTNEPRKLPVKYDPHRPEMTPADDFPQAGGSGGGKVA